MAGKFEPKVPVKLDPPKDDPISLEDLAKADGKSGASTRILGVQWCLPVMTAFKLTHLLLLVSLAPMKDIADRLKI